MAVAKWEHLTCEYAPKPHKWKRPLGLRGRKPRFCDKHKPTPVSVSGTTGPITLHCEIGNHEWTREPTRGRKPRNCDEHKVAPTIVPANRNENGKVTLHCENGNHDWEREPARGRKPTSCPAHSGKSVGIRSVPVNVIPGSETGDNKPKRTKEEIQAAKDAKSRERAANLEGMLKDRGTHISQQDPYILYKKTGEKKGRGKTPPTTTWDKVTEHSPLAMAQYVNAHEKDFEDGLYRYERHGKVIVI